MRPIEACDGARNTDRLVAVVVHLTRVVPVLVEPHLGEGREWRLFTEVDRGALTIRETHDHEAPSADISSGRVDHRQRKARGDRGIDGISASCQYVPPHLTRKRVLGNDHARSGTHRLRGWARVLGQSIGRERERKRQRQYGYGVVRTSPAHRYLHGGKDGECPPVSGSRCVCRARSPRA